MLRQKIDRVEAEGLAKGSCETTWVKTVFDYVGSKDPTNTQTINRLETTTELKKPT